MQHRIDPAHYLTPRASRCPACKAVLPMRVEWPFWRCPQCAVRLIPADLFPPEWATSKPATGNQAAAIKKIRRKILDSLRPSIVDLIVSLRQRPVVYARLLRGELDLEQTLAMQTAVA